MAGLLSIPWPAGEDQKKENVLSKHRNVELKMQNVEILQMWSLTAHGSARWPGPLHAGVSLTLGPVHNSPSKDAFKLFSVWWGDGISADRQLHQGQPHAPHVRLNSVVSALQSLRLLENRQIMSERQVEPRCQGGKRAGQWPGRERHRKWMREIMAEEEKVGGNMARRARECWEPKVRGWEGLAGDLQQLWAGW